MGDNLGVGSRLKPAIQTFAQLFSQLHRVDDVPVVRHRQPTVGAIYHQRLGIARVAGARS